MHMATHQTLEIQMPLGLTDQQLDLRAICEAKTPVLLVIPSDFNKQLDDSDGSFGEVFAIQIILTLARSEVPLRISWCSDTVEKLLDSAATQPLVAVLASLEAAQHETSNSTVKEALPKLLLNARKLLAKYRLKADLFSDRQIVLCTDSRGHSYPPDLYEVGDRIRSRDDFEGLVQDILLGQLANLSETNVAYRFSSALGVIVAELFENTHLHGRFDLGGTLLKPDAMRGLVFKRVKLDLPVPVVVDGKHKATRQIKECLEISVFDTGVGYLQSFTRVPFNTEIELSFEWKVLHKCLERHHSPEVSDIRPSHRGMGLAEVLRALQELQGRIEVRTGRLFAQRTFLPGELQAQMQPLSSPLAYRKQPVPKMLDYQKKYVGIPTENHSVVGAAVRVIVPLQ